MMATKKPVTKKRTTAKKKPVARTKRTKTPVMQSFRVAKADTPFLTFAITRQTLYWSILAAAVLALGIWIIILQNKVNAIYDQIDASQNAMVTLDTQERTLKQKHITPRAD